MIKYRPEIDGLRAIAVIPVVLFHIDSALLPGGFIGVDVFFVISGFLITSLIINDYLLGNFSFTSFWSRRIRRILPALSVMVLVTLAASRIILYAPDVSNVGYQGIASLLSFANISHWLVAGDYWGNEAASSPLLHTWSLSLEEQFYLVFPLFIVITLKFFQKFMRWIFFSLTMFSLLLFLYGTQRHATATFYLLPTRAWELGSGALLASIMIFNNQHIKYRMLSNCFTFYIFNFIATVGFLAIFLSYFFIGNESNVSPFLVIPVLGTIFIIAFSADNFNIINKILSLYPVVYVGKISYSIYLWHWPILVLSKQLFLKKK